jgi:hypothetical protein
MNFTLILSLLSRFWIQPASTDSEPVIIIFDWLAAQRTRHLRDRRAPAHVVIGVSE